MKFGTFSLDGPIEMTPHEIRDERGYFAEVFRADAFAAAVGKTAFVQDDQSLTIAAGTIRGIHFQSHPLAQGKLIRCIAGKVFDVAVDLRLDSPYYGRWISTVLTAESNNHIWIPVSFGYAFCTLEPNSIISYQSTIIIVRLMTWAWLGMIQQSRLSGRT